LFIDHDFSLIKVAATMKCSEGIRVFIASRLPKSSLQNFENS